MCISVRKGIVKAEFELNVIKYLSSQCLVATDNLSSDVKFANIMNKKTNRDDPFSNFVTTANQF